MKMIISTLVILFSYEIFAGECFIKPVSKSFLFKAEDLSVPISEMNSVEECINAAEAKLGSKINLHSSFDDHGSDDSYANRVDFVFKTDKSKVSGAVVSVKP